MRRTARQSVAVFCSRSRCCSSASPSSSATCCAGWRVDLTQNGLYSTAPGTERILKGLKEPVNLYFFYSEKAANGIPDIKTYGNRVSRPAAGTGGALERQPATVDHRSAAVLG